MDIPFHGTYDKKVFLDALKLTERKPLFATIFRYFALFFSLFLISWIIYLWLTHGIDETESSKVLRTLASAIFIGYFYFNGMLVRNQSVARLFRSGPTRTAQGTITFEGVMVGTSEKNVIIPWDRFISKGEKGQLFALMTADGSVAIFQRDFFESDLDWQRFRQIASQKVIEPK